MLDIRLDTAPRSRLLRARRRIATPAPRIDPDDAQVKLCFAQPAVYDRVMNARAGAGRISRPRSSR